MVFCRMYKNPLTAAYQPIMLKTYKIYLVILLFLYTLRIFAAMTRFAWVMMRCCLAVG